MQKFNGKSNISPPSVERFKADVEKRARGIFLKRQETKTPGDALSDWLQAEKQIKGKYSIS